MLYYAVVSYIVLCSSVLSFVCINLRYLLQFCCMICHSVSLRLVYCGLYYFIHMICYSISVYVIILLSSIMLWCVVIMLCTSRRCLISFMSCIVLQVVVIHYVRLLYYLLWSGLCVATICYFLFFRIILCYVR